MLPLVKSLLHAVGKEAKCQLGILDEAENGDLSFRIAGPFILLDRYADLIVAQSVLVRK